MDRDLLIATKEQAEKSGLEPSVLMAVIEVESGGRVFATVNGKSEPLIRFEGHWFDRRLEGASKARARLQGLAAEKAGTVKNPASQTGRWALLEKAMKIDRQAALESTSWGIGQVMGGHWKWLGYENVEAMVETARSGVDGQLSLMLRFIEKSGLLSALKTHDWKRFALAYNGPNAIRNGYDRKLQQSFELWKNHDWASVLQATHPYGPRMLRRGSAGDDVLDLQIVLTARGFPVKPTGLFDDATDKTVRTFQKHAGLVVDGIAGPSTMAALSGTSSRKSIWRRLLDWLFE